MAGYVDNPNGVYCPYTGGNINSCFNYLETNDAVNMYHCFDYYLSRCIPFNPSDTCAYVSSDGFSWADVEAGFKEAFPSLLCVFGAYCIVRLLRMVL